MEFANARYVSETGDVQVEVDGVLMNIPADTDVGYRRLFDEWVSGGGVVEPYQPEPEPEPVTIVYPADLWRRVTNDEADVIAEAMQDQPLRLRKIFEAAQVYRSDDELWPLLQGMAVQLFGETRASEILAPSNG